MYTAIYPPAAAPLMRPQLFRTIYRCIQFTPHQLPPSYRATICIPEEWPHWRGTTVILMVVYQLIKIHEINSYIPLKLHFQNSWPEPSSCLELRTNELKTFPFRLVFPFLFDMVKGRKLMLPVQADSWHGDHSETSCK